MEGFDIRHPLKKLEKIKESCKDKPLWMASFDIQYANKG